MAGIDVGSLADWFSGTMSAIAVITALVAYPIAHRQRRNELLERDKESLASDDADSSKSFSFQSIRPLAIPEHTLPELNQAEIEFLLKNRGAELLMVGSECIRRQASIEHTMRQYTIRHEAFFELMPPPVESDGTLFKHALTRDQHNKVLPYALMLDSLLDGMIELGFVDKG